MRRFARGAGIRQHGPDPPSRLSARSVSHSKSVLYGAFVRARRVRTSPNRQFPSRAVKVVHADQRPAVGGAEWAVQLEEDADTAGVFLRRGAGGPSDKKDGRPRVRGIDSELSAVSVFPL